MRTLASLLIFFSLCSCLHATDAGDILVLKTRGDVHQPAFTVWLSDAGKLGVAKVTTADAEIERFKVTLDSAQRDRIFALASEADDFASGCNQPGDVTSVGMRVIYKGAERTFSCAHAARWPAGEATIKLMDALNGFLPRDMQVR